MNKIYYLEERLICVGEMIIDFFEKLSDSYSFENLG